jgi:hypothetical protein
MITITNRMTFIFTFISLSMFLYSQKYEQVETFKAIVNGYKISSYLKRYNENIIVKVCVNKNCRHFDTISYKETFEKFFQIDFNMTNEDLYQK